MLIETGQKESVHPLDLWDISFMEIHNSNLYCVKDALLNSCWILTLKPNTLFIENTRFVYLKTNKQKTSKMFENCSNAHVFELFRISNQNCKRNIFSGIK